MAKRENRVRAHWVERKSGNLLSVSLAPHDTHSGDYEREVRLKHAVDPVEIVIVPFGEAGVDIWVDAVGRLKLLAAEIRGAMDEPPPIENDPRTS